jgi:hypothetical protein
MACPRARTFTMEEFYPGPGRMSTTSGFGLRQQSCRYDRWTTRGLDPEARKAVILGLYGLSLSEER